MALNQIWYPRMWDEWASSKDEVTGARLEHKTKSHEVSNTNTVKIPTLSTDFLDEHFTWWKPKHANEIHISSYGETDFLANVFPTNISRADMVLNSPSMDEWRFSKSGIVYFSSHNREQLSFELPSADKVFEAWQKTMNIDAHTSNPGKLARQMVKKMGVDHLNLLAYEGFAKMLQNLTDAKGQVKPISYENIWAQIQRFTGTSIWNNPENYFKWLLHKGIFELGTTVECSNCNRTPWYPLSDLDQKVVCNICQEEIDLGFTEPKKQIKWSYRPVGAFSVPELGQGAYTVVLALNFFVEILNMQITPRYSFESNDGTYEADFGALVSPNWREDRIIQLLGECKSFGIPGRSQFRDAELTKLLKLGKLSDNSILVLATLNKTLSESDQRRLKKFVQKLRADRFKGKPSVDVLILTGNELFVQKSLKETWGILGKAYEPFLPKVEYLGVKDLCDVTQQIYLGMETYWDYFDREIKKTQKAAQDGAK